MTSQARRTPWGQPFFHREPGRHEVQVSYRYLRASHPGKAAITVDVAEDQVVPVSCRAPRSVLVAFRPGTLAAQPVR